MGSVVLNGATSGATTITPTDAVTVSLTLPSTSGTLALAGGSTGTVNSGTQYQLGYYASTGTAISGNANIKTDANSNLNLAATSATLNSANTFGFKNRIINGGMVIDQRNAGASVATSGTSPTYTLDRWAANFSQTSKYTVQQTPSTTETGYATRVAAGFQNYLACTSTSAYSLGVTDLFSMVQRIEGYNIADLAWGTANAKTVTLFAWVYSSLTGTFGGSIINSDVSRTYPFTYSIPTANTWTQISVTITGDTTGTWLTTNGVGMRVYFNLGCGTGLAASAGTWIAGGYYGATGCVNVVGTNGATFYITGVQLEVGTQATSFDFRDYGRELMMCQRYYQAVSSPTGGFPYGISTAQVYAGTNVQGSLPLSCPMRATPSATQTGVHLSGGSTGTADVLLSSFGTIYYDGKSNLLGFGGTVASTQTGGYNWSLYLSSTVGYQLSAEL